MSTALILHHAIMQNVDTENNTSASGQRTPSEIKL